MADTGIALEIKRRRRRSYKNLRDAARHLQGKSHDPFGTDKVKSSSLSCVRHIQREADMTALQVEEWADSYVVRRWIRKAAAAQSWWTRKGE